MSSRTIGIIADTKDRANQAQSFRDTLLSAYPSLIAIAKPIEAKGLDVLVALGGDGFMLHVMHNFLDLNIPIYGMNCGTVGFMMNTFGTNRLLERIDAAIPTEVFPLHMRAMNAEGKHFETLAFNEVSLLRQSAQAAKIRILIDGHTHLEEMACDGVLVSTPAGSSAYNFSAGGPILPLRSKLLSLTPISPFRPRRWRGALLPETATIRFDILKGHKRPVSATADFKEVRDVTSVEVRKDTSANLQLLFDPGHSLEERILREQFAY